MNVWSGENLSLSLYHFEAKGFLNVKWGWARPPCGRARPHSGGQRPLGAGRRLSMGPPPAEGGRRPHKIRNSLHQIWY
jgi:hypothetical protein